MPEAVIVSTARSPSAGPSRFPRVDAPGRPGRADGARRPRQGAGTGPRDIDDLMMGCAQPAGEPAANIARAVAVELGYDFLPGTTVNRYCSSSLQTTRMAFHAIKAGEGNAFISAGVETVSRFGVGAADGAPNSKNALFDEAQARTARQGGAPTSGMTRAGTAHIPDVYVAMGQTAENVVLHTGIQPGGPDHWGVRSQDPPREAIKGGFFEREIAR